MNHLSIIRCKIFKWRLRVASCSIVRLSPPVTTSFRQEKTQITAIWTEIRWSDKMNWWSKNSSSSRGRVTLTMSEWSQLSTQASKKWPISSPNDCRSMLKRQCRGKIKKIISANRVDNNHQLTQSQACNHQKRPARAQSRNFKCKSVETLT